MRLDPRHRRPDAGRAAALDEAIADLGGARVFGRGDLATYLDALGIPELEEADQRKLGLAVARRWTVNGTFMPLSDIIEPIVDGETDYPAAFCEGLVEGLLLDHNGYIRTTAEDIERALGVGFRLTAARRRQLFAAVADRVGEARPSAAFDLAAQHQAIATLRTLAADPRNRAIRGPLVGIADHLEAIASPGRSAEGRLH